MKRKNATRNALFTSIISMLLCVSMLVGATFAWFSDTVESGRNTIAAGNLDVELYNQDGQVTGGTVLFDDVTPNLWEPGAVAYEDLQIKNVGTLALRYNLELNVLNETIVNGYKLSDVIMVGIVEGGVGDATREEVIDEVTSWTKLSNFKFDQTAVKLEAGQTSDVFGVVLYWQPNDNETDNHYNMNNENKGQTLKLDIGVTLTAAQVRHENDSFGDDYDEAATPWVGAINTDWYTADPDASEFVLTSAEDLAGFAAIVNGTATTGASTFDLRSTPVTLKDDFKGHTVKLGGDIDLANATWTPIGTSSNAFQGIFDGQGYTVSNLKVTGRGSNVGLFGYTTNGEVKNLTVENASVTGRLNVAVVAGTPYTSKYTNIKVTGHVEVDGLAYIGAVGGKNAYANWDQITVDVDETSYVKAYSIEGGTAYRTYVGGVIGFMGEGGHKVSNVTSNIDVIGSTCDVGGIVGIAHYGNSFENITCTGDVTITNATEAAEAEEIGGIAGVWNNGGADVTFTNCAFTGTLSANYTDGVVLSDNTVTGKAYSASGSGKLIIDGKTTNVVANATGLKDALKNATSGDTVIVGSGEYSLSTLADKEGLTIVGAADGSTVVGGKNTATGYGSNFGKDTTVKNVTFSGSTNGVRYSYANGGTTTFDNCTFAGGSTYGFHIDESNGATFIFNNCTFSGFNAFAGDLVKVVFNNCTFLSNGSYGHTNIWSVGEFNNCTFGDGASFGPAGSGKIYVNGVEETFYHEYIGSAKSLRNFRLDVDKEGASKTSVYYLVDDIDLGGTFWYPIKGSFAGTFDGQGHTIKNMDLAHEYVNSASAAFFNNVASTAVIKNVTFDNANVKGTHYVGVVLSGEWNEIRNATIDNCHVINSTVTCDTDANNDNGDKVGGICGYAVSINITNCSVKNTTIQAYRDFGGILGCSNGSGINVTGNTVENVTLVIDNEVNYKNYTTEAEHNANPVVGRVNAGNIADNIVK